MKIKDDLPVLLMAELALQLGTYGRAAMPNAEQLAHELEAVQVLVLAGELTEEQAKLHRQLHLNTFKMSLLALEGVDDMALERTLQGLGKVVRRFYGV